MAAGPQNTLICFSARGRFHPGVVERRADGRLAYSGLYGSRCAGVVAGWPLVQIVPSPNFTRDTVTDTRSIVP